MKIEKSFSTFKIVCVFEKDKSLAVLIKWRKKNVGCIHTIIHAHFWRLQSVTSST